MADANLLEILEIESRLDNMVVYGNIRCAIPKPEYLSNRVGVTDGFFALVDVLALKCNEVDYFGKHSDYQDSKHIYFSKGSMVIVMNDKDLIGKNVRVYGRSLKGCTIKKQKTNNAVDGVVAFAWVKDKDGNWCIAPNKVTPFGMSEARGTVLEDYLVCLVQGQDFSFTHPESVEGMVEYCGVMEVKSLEFDNIKGGMEYSSEYVDLSSMPLNLVHRLEAAPRSPYADAVDGSVNELKEKSVKYAYGVVGDVRKTLADEFNSDDFEGVDIGNAADHIIDGFVNNIASRYNINISPQSKVKGKEFVNTLLDDMYSVKFRNKEESKDESSENSLELYKDIDNLKKAVQLDPHVLHRNVVTIPVLRDSFKYASMVIGCVTGIGVSSMISNFNSVNRYNDLDITEWFWCILRNPYLCGLMGSDLNIHDCDRIFMAVTEKFSGGYNFNECMKYRDMLAMLDAIKGASSRSTLIPKRSLFNVQESYPALGKRYLADNGTPLKRDNWIAVGLLCGELVQPNKKVTSRNFDSKKILSDLLEAGLLEEVNDGVILSRDLIKEFTIYDFLIEKGKELTGITEEQVKEVTDKFEGQKGFKLESLQRDGIQLIRYKAGVLSGCAGSGKTTTSDGMVMGIEDYLPEYKLRFGAPTGKAARRLAEVVGGNVKTIHSMFGLGLGEAPYITKNERYKNKNDESVKYAYFLDEMAMCNSNLMYEIVSHLNDDDLVYFLGDIKQLSPIGKGSPFRALMQFLPCVELGVSKRAAANGKINYNVGLINFVSDDKVVELQEGDDFEIIPCADVDVQRTTVDVFRKAMQEGYSEDDIQVVTGYQTDKYPWSTVNLNPMLQKLLRKETELLYIYDEQQFMKNDRVIHVKRNAYDMQRFKMINSMTFEEVVTTGVVNGELGKIVGFVNSESCTIIPYSEPNLTEKEWEELNPEMKKLIEKRRERDDLRSDEELKDPGTYFIIVQVYDVDLCEDVVVLYRATYREELSNEFYAKTFSGGDLKFLDLAYALTTHKMQGSQNPNIIIPLGSTGSAQFMNRNMLNTMITRASQKVTLIGSVSGKNSALTNGRRITNIDDGEDMLRLLS